MSGLQSPMNSTQHSHYSNKDRGPAEPSFAISPPTIEGMRANFESCSDCISATQEHDLLLSLLSSVDHVLQAKLNGFHDDPTAFRLSRALQERQAIEKKLEKAVKEAEKKALVARSNIESKRRKIENSETEIQHRLVLREQQLKQNRVQQIEASVYELDYLYKNDPQSLLEDVDKYAFCIKQDIDKFKDLIEGLTPESRKNQALVDYYRTLKRDLGEDK